MRKRFAHSDHQTVCTIRAKADPNTLIGHKQAIPKRFRWDGSTGASEEGRGKETRSCRIYGAYTWHLLFRSYCLATSRYA